MPWPVHPTGFFGARGDSDTYRIERSLRFNSADSTYLSRTPSSSGSATTWTWSSWVKKSSLSSSQFLFSADRSSSQEGSGLTFTSSDTLQYYAYNGATFVYNYITTQLFRDSSSWYHIVATLDTTNPTSGDRVRLYVNGTRITNFSASTAPSQNATGYVNITQAHAIGRSNYNTGQYFSGYLTEIHFIDGQALTPSSFGETDAITGRWKAKAYSGTYGTNGFYLKFADNSGTTATTLGKDSSGNGNNWTPNNFSVTAGIGNDSLVDSPTNYGTDSGVGGEVRGNYATLNPNYVVSSTTFANGNLQITKTANVDVVIPSTISMSSGKWYWEITPTTISAAANFASGIVKSTKANGSWSAFLADGIYFGGDGSAYKYGSSQSSTNISLSANDVLGFALDMDSGTITVTRNGSSVTNGTITGVDITIPHYAFIDTYGNGEVVYANFGQRPFAYTAPTGFKALCTQNLTQPTIQKPSTAMDVVTYTGTGASQSISSLGFSPDLVWIKGRSGATDHALYDVIRGSQARLESNTTDAEVTSDNGLTSFDSAGFTIGTLAQVNTNTATHVGWSWDAGSTNSTNTSGSITSTVRANPQAGFSIVSYTGTGSAATIGHGLGVAPKMIIVKNRDDGSEGWNVYHTSTGAGNFLLLNSTASSSANTNAWNNTSPTSSVFSVGIKSGTGGLTNKYIAYCFAEIEGYSKFGSYTGNGSSDGPFVWCGFRPRFILIKHFSPAGNNWWIMIDTARDIFNLSDKKLASNDSGAENFSSVGGSGQNAMDILSNGFKLKSTTGDTNGSGVSYIFAAFAEAPFKYARAR
jgi:hypothetical protein